jgi:hypothetical protein
LTVLILAGCGGSVGEKVQPVQGPGFRFTAPAGWHVSTSATSAVASHDSQLVQVTTFPLLKPYSDALFGSVRVELDVRMKAVAAQLHGSITGSRTVTAGGIRSHSYQVSTGGDVVEYTFVLRRQREYQLLCRRSAKGSDRPCSGLIRSFEPA